MGAAAALQTADWPECLVPPAPVPPALAAEVRRLMGATPGWLPSFAPVPWIATTCAGFVSGPLAYAPPQLCDFVGLVVSQDNSCRYCYGVQRALLRIRGYSDEHIDRLVRDFHVADFSPTERAALDFGRRLSRANPRPGRADFEEAVAAGLLPEAVREIAVVVAATNFTNRLGTLLALPQEALEGVVERPLFRVVRPFLAWWIRPKLKPPEPVPQPNDGPCAPLVAALAGSPSARVLRRTIDDAWASAILPRRTKMLVLAVVARALDCRYGEAEARSVLAGEGLGAADVDEVLATLGSPRLDAREARLVRFARETVRYQPSVIQPRTREVCRDFTPAETLETIGVIALANAVCRLSVILDAC